MTRSVLSRRWCAGLASCLAGISLAPGLAQAQAQVQAQVDVAQLRAEFARPPAKARPWTWFHVMSGNMSREGITKDLEALERAGVGGIILFHVTQGISFGPIRFNSPEHLDLITHAAAECERLGLAFNFHNADGWSSSGGPWVTPEQSMKRVVWTQALVKGGGKTDQPLRQPATREGFYRDIAVIAYPSLAGELADATTPVRLSSSDDALDFSQLTDGNEDTPAGLTIADGASGWVQFSYDRPVTIQHVRVANIGYRDVDLLLEISDDGISFRKVRDLTKTRLLRAQWEVDSALDPVTAQHFRIGFNHSTPLGEIALSQLPQVDNPSGHSAMGESFGKNLARPRAVPADAVIDPASIVDLTGQMGTDGRLQASLPPGNWTVMRFGYTSTGARNVNPSPEGEGLEVDKFDAAAFRAHYDAFIAPVIARARKVAPNAMTGVMIDSYEVGGQNWTSGYDQVFRASTGDSISRWLPIYAGRLVESPQATSDIFARIRNLNAGLIQQNYYGEFAALMAAQKLESYMQPYGNGPFDELAVASIASVPAGEFWVRRNDLVRLNGAVSAGRIYDKPVVAAEAFTGVWDDNWKFAPDFGKRWGDLAWIGGINQFFFHRFAHQANTHVMPGMTMNRWGSHFDRTQTWWDQGGKAWFSYMARGQHLLRQGQGVADVALLVGSDSPVQCPEKASARALLPPGVEFDCIDTPSLIDRGRFERNEFVLPNGARYRMVWWPHDRAPRPAEMARIDAARAAGVPVALAHRGDNPGAVFTAAGLLPRVSSTGTLPGFTHRRAGKTDIFFTMNDAPEQRSFDLCFRVGGRAGEAWNPVTGQSQALAGRREDDGCSQIMLTLAPYESRFVVFDDALQFLPPDQAASPAATRHATLTGGWSLTFDPAYGAAPPLRDIALFDWSTSDDPEIRHFSGKASYRNTLDIRADDLRSGARFMLDLGRVEKIASVRVNGMEVGTAWTAPYALDISRALRAGRNVIEIELANLWVNRLIGDAALPDTSGYVPESNIGYRREDNLPRRNMVDWYSKNQPPPAGPRRTFATQYFQKATDPLIASGLIGPVVVYRQDP